MLTKYSIASKKSLASLSLFFAQKNKWKNSLQFYFNHQILKKLNITDQCFLLLISTFFDCLHKIRWYI